MTNTGSIHLKAGMTAKVDKDFHNTNMALVDTDVQRCLTALVACVQISTSAMKHTNNFRLVTKCCMMYCPITIFVL